MADLRRDAEALEWVRRIADPEFMDWDAHLAWLESDPDNVCAFDTALLLVEDATIGLPSASPGDREPRATAVNDNHAPWRKRLLVLRWGAGGLVAAAAAGLVALVAIRPGVPPVNAEHEIATTAGETRSIALIDGSRVVLNGETRIALNGSDRRAVHLLSGEAFFMVRHDSRHPFVVRAGRATFQDVGTAFDVRQAGDQTAIEVRDGAVLFDPAGPAVRLNRGQAMLIADGSATVRSIDPAAAGAWQAGKLIYQDAPLGIIAGDLERVIGAPVTLDTSLRERHFSGVIILDANRSRMFGRIGAVMNVTVDRDGRGWRLKRRP